MSREILGWSVAFIAGSQSQVERIENMRRMKNYEIRVFVCTDLISRGVDLEHVDLVVNMDVPKDWKTYIHRVGRAGRFGDKGAAFTLLSDKDDVQKIKIIARRCNLENMMMIDNVATLSTNFISEDFCDLQLRMVQKFKQFSVWNSVELDGEAKMNANNNEKIVSEDVNLKVCEEKTDEKLSMDVDSERKCGDYDSEVTEDDLTIPKDLYSEIGGLVHMYNSVFQGSVKKVKLNVDQFTYKSFKEHYTHFHETGEFREMPEWTTVEYEPIPKLTMKNFVKPKKALASEKTTNNASTQTEKTDCCSEDSDRNIEESEVSNVLEKECITTDANVNDSLDQPSRFPSDDISEQSRNVHAAYLNSAQRMYLSNMMNLYYGQ